ARPCNRASPAPTLPAACGLTPPAFVVPYWRREREGPMEFAEQETLQSPTGAALRVYATLPAGTPRAVVQVSHGLAEDGARDARVAAFLADGGFETYAHDQSGHGHTTAPGAPLGAFGPEPMAGNVVADVLAVHDGIAGRHPAGPVIAFGHSMGALVAMN